MLDLEIRTALRNRLRAAHADDPDARILEELELCLNEARIDLAVVNGRLEGYEIKSDRDTLARLHGQAATYGRVFDRLTLVVGVRHLDAIYEAVPSWWGIMRAEPYRGGVRLRRARPGRVNPGRDPISIALLLRRDEVLAALDQRRLAHGIRSKPNRALCERLADEVSLKDLRSVVRAALASREPRPAALPSSRCGDTYRPSSKSSGFRSLLPPHKCR
jgi:hypothetical protein